MKPIVKISMLSFNRSHKQKVLHKMQKNQLNNEIKLVLRIRAIYNYSSEAHLKKWN